MGYKRKDWVRVTMRGSKIKRSPPFFCARCSQRFIDVEEKEPRILCPFCSPYRRPSGVRPGEIEVFIEKNAFHGREVLEDHLKEKIGRELPAKSEWR
jgi:hypothetical protein